MRRGARTSHHLQPAALRYELNVNGSGTTVTGDAEELRTAISNVIENAIKYSLGKVDVDVVIEAPDEKRIRLRVRDHGVDPYRRIDSYLQTVLPRAKPLRHQSEGHWPGPIHRSGNHQKAGGRVTAHSEGEGQGTTVTLDLPRTPEKVEP